MKKIIYFFSLLLFTFCKAQTPIVDRFGNEEYGTVNGAYYKDINGFLNQYVGTWLYTNGTTTLKLIFQKRTQKRMDEPFRTYYEDMLVGEYQYIQNGIEKVNTLNQINTDFGTEVRDMYNHYLAQVSCIRFPTARPKCNECSPNEKRIQMSLSDPNFRFARGFEVSNSFVLRSFTESGVQKLKVWFVSDGDLTLPPMDENENPINFTGFSLPFGEYTLIKQ